jgi:beige protein homolog 1
MPKSTTDRPRAVSATSSVVPQDEELAPQINALADVDDTSFDALRNALDESACLQQLRHNLTDHINLKGVKDAFRRLGGFQQLLALFGALSSLYDAATITGENEKHFTFVLGQTLAVLAAALQGHAGNQKYFRTRIDGGGWGSLQKSLGLLLAKLPMGEARSGILEKVLGLLFATVAGQEMIADIYMTIGNETGDLQSEDETALREVSDKIRAAARKGMTSADEVSNPELLVVMADLWLTSTQQVGGLTVLRLALPASIQELLLCSSTNIVAAHTAGLLSKVLPFVLGGSFQKQELLLWQDVALILCEEGMTNLDDARLVFLKASTSPVAASFLQKAIAASRTPPSIQFDLSLHGYSSLELSTLGRPFPPLDTAGYTLALWARFDQFDTSSHTTIFGAFDTSQTCFVLAYIEKDTRNFILQTSIRGSKPSVRFKSTKFEAGRWYHICVTHRRPRTIASSRAFLFVDGEFVEQVKATYPSQPPASKTNGSSKVQAFFGTPQDLSQGIAKGSCLSRWSLASAALYQDIFSDDFIAVVYNLGPAYHGNFQDCLGSFQTYEASAALNLRNENLNAGKEEQSDVVLAIRHKASSLVHENGILLNVSPAAVLDNDDRNNIDESQLIKSLSKTAAKNLQQYMRAGSNAVAVNAAIPAINAALTHGPGVAILTGAPAVAVPQSLEDAAWRLGGCTAVALTLVYTAKTTEEVAMAVKNLFEMVVHSWRNSEAMEKDSGYAILAALLTEKLGLSGPNFADVTKTPPAIPTSGLDRSQLALDLLKSVLEFVGYDFENPESSVINNPLAYRVLLIDTNLWRKSAQPVQELYFRQFIVFATESTNHRFNVKRLTRMRALKKLLEALKSEAVSAGILSSYMAAIKILLPSAMSAEMLRSLALFITYTVNKRSAPLLSRRSTKREATPRMSFSSSSTLSEDENTNLSRFEIGVEVLRLYSDFLCRKDDTDCIRKFARTVTNKWLLYLMSESSPEVVVLATRILARLLVVHGDAYIKKFKDKSGGFVIMRHRLKRWWHLPALWPALFAVIFNFDIGKLDLDRTFDLFGLLDLFDSDNAIKVVYPEAFAVVHGMLQSGLRTIVHSKKPEAAATLQADGPKSMPQTPQRLSMSTMAPPDPFATVVAGSHIETLHTVVRFLADLQGRSQSYRDYAVSSTYVQDLLQVLFPVVVGSDVVDAVVELNARDSALTFDGHDVVVQPLSTAPPIIRTADVDATPPGRGKQLARGNSYVIVSTEQPKHQPSALRLQQTISPIGGPPTLPELSEGHKIVQSILEAVISVSSDQILARKDFPGLGLFLRTPPGFVEHQSYFESWILRNTLSQLSNTIMLDPKVLQDPKVLTNLSRLFSHLGEALFEGWFMGGADSVLDFSGTVLEYLQRPDISQLKSVRLCKQATSVIRAVVFRTVLLSLSQMQESDSLEFLEKLTYWQTVLLSAEETQSSYLQLVCYLLYASLISTQASVRTAAANLWRIILIQKPEEAAAILGHATSIEHKKLISSFEKLIEVDNDTFLYWVDDHRDDLDSLFFEVLSQSWDNFVTDENKRTEETARNRVSMRREKLKQWARDESDLEELIRRHEVTFEHWTSNIYTSEYLKHQRVTQDVQDDHLFTTGAFAKMQQNVKQPVGFLAEDAPRKWRLDQTEGRNRMRLRLMEDFSKAQEQQQPKRKGSEGPKLRLDTRHVSSAEAIGVTPGGAGSGSVTPLVDSPHPNGNNSEPFPDLQDNLESGEKMDDVGESFEIIEDPNEGTDDYEDKNRKVMRSLHRGDQVKHVANISRIVGLEAIEGLLILGKDHLYLIDNFFQRADGEIMNVWQAPQEERDPYVRMISGKDVVVRKTTPRSEEHETRSWKWSDIISVSKRRFLFRDVAIEIFFADGQSYLLTVISPQGRNELHAKVNGKAPQYGTADLAQSENAWRYESLRSPEEEPQTLGSRFANVFNSGASYAATRKWQRGEISNFHYLMHINTMAGRTYNDLTQYPVFPWIIADYTSDELDLSNPMTFRDLSKPMGCQTVDREAEFRERYKMFAEMGGHDSPPFHYGTHYSSAMIVTSYLIRLQPFVKSYLLLQGGTFDHPDRMFYSIEKAWVSASRQNMTDVRELTPEFFYLPEFLTNVNDYDFGTRQNSDSSIGTVELPPWAKGDPKVFIAKHREALESPFVSKNLHKWIDLVFGSKQKGEAALDAVNVFHHLSYQGARDLDNIENPMERLATIGIIHNFGQTPFQVFQKPHPAREEARHKYKRLDSAAESLTRLPALLLDDGERVASLSFSWKQDRLLCAGAFRLNIPPEYTRYMEWGFSDNSVRFYANDSRKMLGHFEHVHIGQLSCAAFVDSKTLVTSGADCTVAIWNVVSTSKNVDIQPKASLFGHRKPVTTLAISRSFNALLTVDTAGEVLMWDLNRSEFVRKIASGLLVESAAINDITGNLVLCHDSTVSMFNLNGELLLTQDTSLKEKRKEADKITSCACYEGADNEWLERDILFTGHKGGVVKIWSKIIQNGTFELELIRQLNHADPQREDGGNVNAGISCILPMPQAVYTGDEDGKVVSTIPLAWGMPC